MRILVVVAMEAEVELTKTNGSDTVGTDVEAAAVAWTCERLDTPFTALKGVTDLVDHHEEAADQFVRNLRTATSRLAEAVPALVNALTARQPFPTTQPLEKP